jgi:hypothetical protein
MALRTVKHSDPPCVAKQFATLTAAVLHDADAPAGCKHLPAGVIAQGADSTATVAFVWVDALGTTITSALCPGVFTPISPAQIAVTNVPVVTVFWRK